MTGKSDHLTHLVYEASLDNSLWPELVLELTEQLQSAGTGQLLGDENGEDLANLAEHFRRAFAISEKMVGLQEREAHLGAVLNTFSFGLALIDDTGQVMLQNRSMSDRLSGLEAPAGGLRLIARHEEGMNGDDPAGGLPMVRWVEACNLNEAPRALALKDAPHVNLLMLPRREAVRMGFPAKAAAVLLSTDLSGNDGLRAFAKQHGLTRRETDMAGAMYRTGDIRSAAAMLGLSYESARTYLKRVYEKSGVSGQAELITSLARSPLAVLRRRQVTGEEAYRVRRTIALRDGRVLEYFTLGPENGYPVVHFDALAGMTIDIVGYPAECLEHLERYNIRLITPCRPGGFRSDMKVMTSLRDFAPDVEELLDQIGVERFSICSVSYGSGSAMAVAHELQGRIDRVVMSSVSYPGYKHPDWRELDLFYQMSGILGRYWPSMLRQIIPFLVRSVMQNVDRYFDRTCKKAKSAHDIALLSHPTMRRRTVEMLAERTASGMDGMVEENLLNAQGWDFAVQNIGVPVEIAHGTHDNVTPIQGAELLVRHLPQARLLRLKDKGHYHHIVTWPTLLARAAGHDTSIEDRHQLPG